MSFGPAPKPPLAYGENPLAEPLVYAALAKPGGAERPGAERPGGGPVAAANPGGAATLLPKPGIAEVGVTADGGPIVADCPVRTPSGFLEKLRRMPPFTLLCNG